MKSEKLKKFDSLVSDEKSNWLEKALWRKANKKWLDQSAKIALNVLEALKEKGWSQIKLAEEMKVSKQQVNKILRGQQNLTFETVAKLETALDISLIEIIDYRQERALRRPINATVRPIKEPFSIEAPRNFSRVKFTGMHKMTVSYNRLAETRQYKTPA